MIAYFCLLCSGYTFLFILILNKTCLNTIAKTVEYCTYYTKQMLGSEKIVMGEIRLKKKKKNNFSIKMCNCTHIWNFFYIPCKESVWSLVYVYMIFTKYEVSMSLTFSGQNLSEFISFVSSFFLSYFFFFFCLSFLILRGAKAFHVPAVIIPQ